jgi:flagellar basal-body rod protein FlgF
MGQGGTRFTENTLDFAISGNGFFKVNTPEGIRYTRKGNFSLDAEGTLVTQEGFKVMGAGGPIIISGNETYVDGKGVIKVDGSDVGRIDVVDFEKSEDLIKEGKGLFRNNPNDQEVAPPPETKIQQGYVELSNVNVTEEMVNMIHSLRAFESYQKAIQVLDGLNSRAINEVGRLR